MQSNCLLLTSAFQLSAALRVGLEYGVGRGLHSPSHLRLTAVTVARAMGTTGYPAYDCSFQTRHATRS